jgi:SAM-dependent methyltransferase
MERAVFDRMAELDQDHWWFVARRRILTSVIRRIVRPKADAQILEIGCGTGHNLAMLGRFGRVAACELDDDARSIAAARSNCRVEPSSLPALAEFGDERFDLIALLDVLEHIADDGNALAAIADRLAPGGSLLLTVPANPWMWSAHDVAHHHYRRYSKAELRAALDRAGFEIRTLSFFNTLLFPLVAAARIVGKLTNSQDADDRLPPRPLNAVLRFVFEAEAGLVGTVPLPFGVSLLAVASRCAR